MASEEPKHPMHTVIVKINQTITKNIVENVPISFKFYLWGVLFGEELFKKWIFFVNLFRLPMSQFVDLPINMVLISFNSPEKKKRSFSRY